MVHDERICILFNKIEQIGNTQISSLLAKGLLEIVIEDGVLPTHVDDSMKAAFERGWVDRFRKWIEIGGELSTLGILGIGNLARTDENCRSLIASGVIEVIAPRLESDDIKTRIASVGALKNLAIRTENKARLDYSTLTEHEQFLNVSLVRSLCAVKENLAYAKQILPKLRDAYFRHSEHEGILSEVGRIFALMSTQPNNEETIVDSSGIQILMAMLKSRHSIIQAEGMAGLSRLAKHIDRFELDEYAAGVRANGSKELNSLLQEVYSQIGQ